MDTNILSTRPFRPARPALAVLAITTLAAGPAVGRPWLGLSSHRAHLLTEEVQGIHGPFALDQFAFALAAGDFNADGIDDLALGIPGNDCGTNLVFDDCGAVQVRLGLRNLGIVSTSFVLAAENGGQLTPADEDDRLGYALAVGDFDGDGHDDLAVGQPDAGNDTGAVAIYPGYDFGILLVPTDELRPGTSGVPASPASSFNFGAALASGNFNCDAFDDLAVGYPSERIAVGGQERMAGSVIVANGSNGGLLPFDGYRISQEEPGIPDESETGDRFGEKVAAGDFNGDGCDDLAIGAPDEDGAGAVLVLFGTPNGLIFANTYWLGAVDLGTVGILEDRLGASLATGDWNGDGFDDLAIGVPERDDVDGDLAIGMFGSLYGAPGSPANGGGFNFGAFRWWWEAILPDHASLAGDRFGAAFASGDFTGDGFDDLAIGAPGNGGFGGAGAGQVSVMVGGPGGLGTAEIGYFCAGCGAVPGLAVPQSQYHFGAALAAGDFDGNGHADLAIAMPDANVTAPDDGAAVVLYGSLFRDGFESGGTQAWSAAGP